MITDVSRLRPHLCTIITSIASNTDCEEGRRTASSTLDKGHQSKNVPLFDHVVGTREQHWRHLESENPGRLSIDNQLELA